MENVPNGFLKLGSGVWEESGGLTAGRAFLAGRAASAGGTVGFGLGPGVLECVKTAFLAGLTAGGSQVWSFGEASPLELTCCTWRAGLDRGIHLEPERVTLLTKKEPFLPLVKRAPLPGLLPLPDRPGGRILSLPGARALYFGELVKSAVCSLTGVRISLRCGESRLLSLAGQAVEKLGGRLEEGGDTLFLLPGRGEAAFVSRTGRAYDGGMIRSVLAADLLRRGEDAVLFPAEERYEKWVRGGGGEGKLLFWGNGASTLARQTALNQPFLFDGAMMGIRALSLLNERRCTLDSIFHGLSDRETPEKHFALSPRREGSQFIC